MKIYNTLTQSIEPVRKLANEDVIGVYACGPTVYDYAHIGHARKYTMDDVLIRTLRLSGLKVKHVMNITDVGQLTSDADTGEDKMEKGARKFGKTVWEVAEFFEEDFWRKADLLGLRPPGKWPKATKHIPQQIKMVKKLRDNGFTYEIPGDGIYFDTSKDPHYGELARLKLNQQLEGARIGVTEGKRNPSDFALWKFSSAENEGDLPRRQMEWYFEGPKVGMLAKSENWLELNKRKDRNDTWFTTVGFPGWHIECSAMSMEYLGEQFAFHTGGIDHIPVHHTNEIAQAENATGKRPFVRYWVHHNFLRIDGKKMSKSLNNFYTLDDVIAKGFSPMALKLLFLQAHYRDELNFTWDSLAGTQKGYEKLQRQVKKLLSAAGYETLEAAPEPEAVNLSDDLKTRLSEFVAYLEDDLKTAQALAVMWKTVKGSAPEALPVIKRMFEYFGLAT